MTASATGVGNDVQKMFGVISRVGDHARKVILVDGDYHLLSPDGSVFIYENPIVNVD